MNNHLSVSSMEMFKRSAPHQTPNNTKSQLDFLTHLQLFLSKRDSLDKLLKLLRYASKIILSSSLLQPNNPFSPNLNSFHSSIHLTRKAFRLAKFIQPINAFRTSKFYSKQEFLLSLIAYAGQGFYYFVEHFVWLAKSGLITERYVSKLERLGAWFELVGYFGSVSLKVMELKEIGIDEKCLVSSIELAELREIECREELERLRKVREDKFMIISSVLQDLGDGLVALADLGGGGGMLLRPWVVSTAGFLSALISTHKNWVSSRDTVIS